MGADVSRWCDADNLIGGMDSSVADATVGDLESRSLNI